MDRQTTLTLANTYWVCGFYIFILSIIVTLWGRKCCCPPFINEKTKIKREWFVQNFTSGNKTGNQTQAV